MLPQQQQQQISQPSQITNAEELERVLLNLMVPQSAIIKQAESVIKVFLKQRECMVGFVSQIKGSTHVGVRQLSAVLMRLKMKNHWKKLDAQVKEEIKFNILNALLSEPTHLVRTSIIQLVGSMTLHEISNWPDLPKFLSQCVSHEQSAFRELGITLFTVLIENTPDEMLNNFSQILAVFQAGLMDSDSAVRIAALKGIRQLVLEVDDVNEEDGPKQSNPQLDAIIQVIPQMLEALKHCIAESRYEEASNAFEIFDELVEHKSTAFDKIVPNLLSFMCEIAVNTQLTNELRGKATTFMEWTITYKPKLMIKLEVVPHILNVAFALMSERREEELEEGYEADEDEHTPYDLGSALLDNAAVELPSKYVFKDIIERALPLCQSANEFDRRAGITALGIISEGCQEAVKANLEQVVSLIAAGFTDESKLVRACAILAISSLAEFCQPEILKYHEKVLPFIIHNLTDKSFEIKEKSAYSLDIFTQHMEGEPIKPYLESILNNFYSLLTSNDRKSQEVAVAGISAAASAAGKLFEPYFNQFVMMMKQLMEAEGSSDLLVLKSRATECVGIIAFAVGKQTFAPFVDGFMRLAMANVEKNNSSEFKEYTFMFFESMAMTLGEDYKVYLPTVGEYVVNALCAEDTCFEVEGNDGNNIESYGNQLAADDDEDLAGDGNDENDSDDDMGFDGTNYKFSVRTSAIDERSAAISCACQIAKATGPHFAKYLHQVIDTVIDYAGHFHYSLRRQSMTSIRNLVFAAVPTLEYQTENQELNEDQRVVVNKVMQTLVQALTAEEDKETVARACESIIELSHKFGLLVLGGYITEIMDGVIQLLRQNTPCNSTEMEDEGDHDIVLIDVVADIVDTIAGLLGPEFAPFFEKVFPDLMKYLQPTRPIGDRIMALGTICESLNSLQEHMKPYVQHVLPIILQCIKDPHYNAQRNAIYGVGVIAFFNKDEVQPHVMPVLASLHPIFVDPSKYHPAVVDNACGAIARFIACGLQMPLDQVLPVFLSALPLREDFEECPICYTSLSMLLENPNNTTGPLLPQILQKLVEGLTLPAERMKDKVKMSILESIRKFSQQYGQQFQQLVASLPPNQQQALQQML
ncbi:hypothetical protein FDP41_008945 [Naegleria fowleri]|uniref:Importin N-terminal domain-containing protein n=1 Tax=Naegleria fowleri TaxID=5763 RepID=A0A6A5BDC0_NAEFO|nr:uncharacterized protein FDP41_008945 [Naegleria fowleri]KAF0972696.1 hypothetical protein FDP41_008945 [Naegleria fowleri]